ncbi:Fur-regulated protein, partial [Citrobacter freundii]
MAEKIITLSGAANEVLYALFFRGALLSGDLPSKSGTAELRELGFAETRHTETEYQKENHFTFLTSEGQKFAVEHLVNTRFGKQQYCASMALGVEIDTSAAQKAIDELDQRIRDTVSFELIRNGV